MGTSHPVDSISVSPVTKSAIDFVVKNEPVDVAKYRLRTIIDIKRLQKDLADEDSSIKRSMDIKLRKRLQNKVMNLLTEGVPLVGCDDSSRGFDRHMVPATLTPEELLKSSLWRRKAIMGSHKSIDEKDINSMIETSNDEVARGFLEGPFSESEMSDLVGHHEWLLNPRFVLYQGESSKVRIIDDAKVSSLNAAYTSVIKLQLQDSDHISAMAMEVARTAKHSSQPKRCWLGKTYGLKKAYKLVCFLLADLMQ